MDQFDPDDIDNSDVVLWWLSFRCRAGGEQTVAA